MGTQFTGNRHKGDRPAEEPSKLLSWAASLAVLLLIIITQFIEGGDNPYLRAAGIASLALSVVFIFVPFYLLGKYGGKEDAGSYMQTLVLVDRGLYAIIRHPQYLGYMLLAGGFAMLLQHWAGALLAALVITFFYLQAVEEERYCLDRLGEPYAQYLKRVPRFNFILGILRLLLGK